MAATRQVCGSVSAFYSAFLGLWLVAGQVFTAHGQAVSYTPTHTVSTFNALTVDVNLAVGSTPASADISSSGGSTYSLPIAVPPGTNGVVPSVGLAYNSQAGNGIAGTGWSISGLSVITRVSRSWYYDGETNGVEMSNNDRFVLDGSRLMLKSGSNGTDGATYGTESETFATITAKVTGSYGAGFSGPEWFEVVTKDGTIMEYGRDPYARLSGQYATMHTWALNKIQYPDGNYIEFTYKQGVSFNLLLDAINYTGNAAAGLAPYNQVKFDYKIRQDVNTVYQADNKIESKYLLDKVTVTAEGQPVKTYQLNYGTDPSYGANFGSYLKSLTEAGSDGATLNSTNFKYGDTPAGFSPVQSQAIKANGIVNLTGDFNGDGITDVLCADHQVFQVGPQPYFYSTKFQIYTRALSTSTPEDYGIGAVHFLPGGTTLVNNRDVMNASTQMTAHDFTGDGADDVLMAKITESNSNFFVNFIRLYRSIPNPNWATNGQPAVDFDSITIDPPVGHTRINASGNFLFYGDFNGDGIQDILSMLGNTVNGANTAHIYYSQQPSPSFGTIGTSGSFHFSVGQWATADKVVILDFNGDGKSDLMLIKNYECEIITLDGYQARQLYYANNNQYLNVNTLLYPGDFNGDQKTDFLSKNTITGFWKTLISTGKTYQEGNFSFNHTPNTSPYTGDQLAIADFNGDGKSDVYHGWQAGYGNALMDVYYSTSYDYWSQLVGFVRVNQTWGGDLGTAPGNNLGSSPLLIGDANGDGRADLMNFKNVSTPFDIFYFRKEGTEHLLQKVRNGYGHELRFSYKKLTDETQSQFYTQGPITPYPLLTMQLPIYAVWEQKAQNGVLSENTTQYTYAGLRLHRAGKGFLGFTTINALNVETGIKTVSTNQVNAQFYTSAPYQTSTYLGSTLLSQTTLTNNWIDLGNKRFWYRTDASSTNNAFEGRSASTANQYDSYGNVTQRTTNNNNVETTTTNTLYGQYGTPVPAKPTTSTTSKTRSGQAVYSVTTTFNYNAIGQLTSKTDFFGLPKSVNTTYGYNSFGNVTNTTVSPSGMTARSTSAVFDPKGRFALTSTNVLGQTASATYDARWGKPLTSTGIDGLTTSYQYDAWGRTTQTTLPEGYAIAQHWGWDLAYPSIYYNQVTHPGKPDVKIWYDLLGREVRKQTEGFGGQWLTQSQTYDARGNVATSTQPYLAGESVLTTTTNYDAYNRVSTISVTGLGTTTMGYSYAGGNLTTTTTNPAGQVSRKVTDASGQTISASDNGGTLSYVYNSQGNLLSVSNGASPLASHLYDAYGRQTQLTDQNAGTTTYNYDALGQLTSQTNANGHTHAMLYDLMGRIQTRNGPEGTTTTEYYPAGSAAVNQIKKVTSFAGNTTDYVYDNYGRLSSTTEAIDGQNLTTSYQYNTYGDVTKKSYPSGFATNHNYDSNGYPTTIKNGDNSVTLYAAGSHNGLGQPLTYTLGNGKTATNTYEYGLPKRYFTPGVQDLNLTWTYTTGNLQQRVDAIKNKTESFTYDHLNRLEGSTVSGLSGIYLDYNANGNIEAKTDAGQYSYLASKPNAVSAVTNPITAIPWQQQLISYTPFLQPQTLTENGNILTYTYGADYERIKGVLSLSGVTQNTRYYAGPGYEKTLGPTPTQDIHYIDAPAGLIAMVVRENGVDTYHYIYSDHLGSILTVTNSSGAVEAEQNFDAWGRRRNPTDWSYNAVPARPHWLYRGYTGHEMLDPFVLINMNGRIYDPVVGRVLSPDNYVQDPLGTQSYNRYSYALNNPLKYSDPDGNFAIIPLLITAIQVTSAIIEGAAISGTVYALNAAITGQSLGGMGQALLWGGISAGASFGIGSLVGPVGGFGREALRAGLHGSVGGVANVAQGGNFGSGFVSSAVGSLVGSGLDGLPGGVQIGASALVGGVSAELSGGDFLQGAVQAGMVAGFNHFVHRALQDPPAKKSVDEPGTLEGLVPIWGSGRQAVHDFQEGDYGWAALNGAMAISDVMLVKSLGTAVGKGVWKLGSHSWNATRKWMLKQGYAEANQPLHHWALTQKTAKKYGLEAFANQPWNMKVFKNQSLHMRAGHGQTFLRQPGYGTLGQLWYGTPIWPKAVTGSYGGRTIQGTGR